MYEPSLAAETDAASADNWRFDLFARLALEAPLSACI